MTTAEARSITRIQAISTLEELIPEQFFVNCGGDARIQVTVAAAVYIASLTTGEPTYIYLDTSKVWTAALWDNATRVLRDIIPDYITSETRTSSGGKSANKTTKLLRRAANYIEALERGRSSVEVHQEAVRLLEEMEGGLRAKEAENRKLRTLLESRGMAATLIDGALQRAFGK